MTKRELIEALRVILRGTRIAAIADICESAISILENAPGLGPEILSLIQRDVFKMRAQLGGGATAQRLDDLAKLLSFALKSEKRD
jgi:ABC-type proline/glycine betaine transport system permease subunit